MAHIPIRATELCISIAHVVCATKWSNFYYVEHALLYVPQKAFLSISSFLVVFVHAKKKQEASPHRPVRALRCLEFPVKGFEDIACIWVSLHDKLQGLRGWGMHQAPGRVEPPPPTPTSSLTITRKSSA
jgi:hypothetical protein